MSDDSKPILRLGLKRLDPVTLVSSDPVLRRSPFVVALGAGREEILRGGGARRLAKGMRLWGPGDEAREVLLVAAGTVQVFAKDGAQAVPALELGAGEVVGASAALGHRQRSCVVVCASEVDAIVWEGVDLALLAHTDPKVAGVLEEAARREEEAADELSAFLDRW
ncbi:MAG: cyclic nucleotide-binding domain-containing protein [Deltaproteobacteria bacterium]|nr:MAG: cyclic nucleotide-binding domain-containing protein [Deltaproteobacteria bacterium]